MIRSFYKAVVSTRKLICMIAPVLVLSFPLSAAAQEQARSDSLVAELGRQKSDTAQCRLLLELAEHYEDKDTLLSSDFIIRAIIVGKRIDDKSYLGKAHKLLGKKYANAGNYKKAILEYDRSLSFYNEANDNYGYYEVLKDKGNIYLFMSEYEQAETYYETALDFYRRNNNRAGASRCLNNLGIIYKNRGEYVEALSAYEESIRFIEEKGENMQLAQGLINMGNVLVFLGSYEQALDYYQRALVISEREGSMKDYALCLMNTGVVQTKCGNHEAARQMYERALDMTETLGNPVLVSNCLVNIGTASAAMGEYDKGLDYVRQGLKIKEELGDKRTISNGYITMAEILLMKDEDEQAIELLNRAIPIKEDIGDREGLVRCYLGLAQIGFDRNDLSVARQMATEARVLADSIGSLEHMATAYGVMEKVAERSGDYRAAYRYKQTLQAISDSLLNESTSRTVMEMKFRHRSNVLARENEVLKVQSALTAELMRKRNAFMIAIIGIAVMLTVGLVLGLILFQRLRKTARKVEEKNLVITRQNLRLDTMNRNKDRMMSIIAHDLRGTIGNQLTAIEVMNRVEASKQENFDKKKLLGNLKHSASYSLELLENLLLWSRLEEKESYFHPDQIDLSMLVRICISLFNETAENKGISIENSLDSKTMIHADRVMLETMIRNLLSNAIKFSESDSSIRLSAEKMNGSVRFTIADQGIGMSPEQIDKVLNNGGYSRRGTANEKGAGIGMALVREFAQAHHAELEIDSATGKGTSITIIFQGGEHDASRE